MNTYIGALVHFESYSDDIQNLEKFALLSEGISIGGILLSKKCLTRK